MSAKVSAEEFKDYIGDEVDRSGKYGKWTLFLSFLVMQATKRKLETNFIDFHILSIKSYYAKTFW